MKRWPLLIVLWCPLSLQADEVNVSGQSNLGIGTMNSGTVNFGLTEHEAEALAKASGDAIFELLSPILERINTQVALINDENTAANQLDKLSLGAAQTFLATIQGKDVPQEQWPVVFGILIREYQQLGRQIEETPVTSDEIQALVDQADDARQQGDLDKTDQLLVQADEMATREVKRKANEALESKRQLASLKASRATLAMTKLERSRGASLYEEAYELRKGDETSEVFWWLIHAGEAWLTEGRSEEALRAFQSANSVALAAIASEPSST